MYCSRCGQPNDDSAERCVHCGRPIAATVAYGPIGGPSDAADPPYAEPADAPPGEPLGTAVRGPLDVPEQRRPLAAAPAAPLPEREPRRRRRRRRRPARRPWRGRRTVLATAFSVPLLLLAAVALIAWRGAERTHQAQVAFNEAIVGQVKLSRAALMERYKLVWQEPELRGRLLTHLAGTLGSEEADRRRTSLDALGELDAGWAAGEHGRLAVDVLDRLRRTGPPDARLDVVRLLRLIARSDGRHDAAERLIEAVADRHTEVAMEAVLALNEVSPGWSRDRRYEQMLPRLIDSMCGADAERCAVAMRIGDEPGAALLLAAYVQSIGSDQPGESLLAAIEQLDRSLRSGPEAEKAARQCARLLFSPVHRRRSAAAAGLAAFGDERAAAPLLEAYVRFGDAPDEESTRRALRGIELRDSVRRERDEAVPRFSAALRDPDRMTRRRAARALGWTLSDKAIAPLTGALEDSDPTVRDLAGAALAAIDPDWRNKIPDTRPAAGSRPEDFRE